MTLRHSIFRNISIKIVGLVFAALFWLYAVMERNQVVTTELPVSVGKAPPGMIIAGLDTARVTAQLTGKGRDLVLLRFRRPEFRLNVANQSAGRSRIKLTQEQSTLPATVQVKLTKPEYVNVDLDQQARRSVKVNVPLRGKPAQGLVVTGIRALENAFLAGPQEDINLVPAVNTESLSIGNLIASGQRRLRLLSPDSRRFQVDPESVTVAVTIDREETRLFPEVAVSVFKPTFYSVALKPAAARITVAGAAAAVKALAVQDIAATLKIADTVPRGKRTMPIEITLPPGISLVKCDPALFDVEIK